jgi:hypothetical protein
VQNEEKVNTLADFTGDKHRKIASIVREKDYYTPTVTSCSMVYVPPTEA